MSDKLVRDELLRSHRYQTLSSDTCKLLFFHLLLASDNFSNAEATTTALTSIMGRTMTEAVSATLLGELADKDLIRVYEVDAKRYVHIPRSRQRIRYMHAKHPRPPANIEDKGIRELIEKVSLESGASQTQDGRREEKRSVAKQPKTVGELSTAAKKWWANTATMQSKATALGLSASPPGETRDALYRRIRAALDKEKTK